MSRGQSLFSVTVLAAAMLLAMSSPSSAHERRTVGPYQLEVGWLTEPAYAGSANAVFLQVQDTRTTPPTPVEGLAATLTVEVRHGGLAPLALALSSDEDRPGIYTAVFVPTRTGDYAFDLTGKIGDLAVSERFESGPGRFDTVQEAGAVQYPDRVPTGSDLARRLDAIDRDLGSIRGLAIAALALAIVLPVGNAFMRRRTRS